MTLHPLARRQLRKAFRSTVLDLPELDAFVGMVSSAYAAIDTDRELTERSLQLASDELAARNEELHQQVEELRRLERAVAIRTAELDRRTRAMARILDHVAQGLATVDLDGVIGSECSRALAFWFGEPSPATPLWRYLAPADPALEAWIQLGFDSLRTGAMPTEVVLAQLPARIVHDGRQFHVDYDPIGEPVTALLLVVSDITEELAVQRVWRAQHELIAGIEAAHHDRASFLAFLRETDAMIADRAAALTVTDRLRQLHTLKGSAGLFGLGSIAEHCHELETLIETHGRPPEPAEWAPLVEAWRELYDQLDRMLGVAAHRTVVVDWRAYQAVVDAIDDRDAPWARELRRWGQDATRPHLEQFADEARRLARQLGKPELDIVIDDREVRTDPDRFAPLWMALVHAVRNAVDHGLESVADRAAAGKPERARLRLATVPRGHELAIELEDDGAGIDWPGVAARAAVAGLPHATRGDLVAAIFTDGVSTAPELTQTSGRGVGMAALRATCAELGGRVELDSEPGRGTLVRCVVPTHRPSSPPRCASLMRG